MREYKNFISLGYFCSIAQELERLGLRSCSSPFDWCISEWSGIERAITTNFEGFLDYDKLYQHKSNRGHYRNIEYGISFFHDFNKYDSLEEQLPGVKEKYDRRIKRFYSNIQEPTLFIRYISTNHSNSRHEIDYLENNYKYILDVLRAFNRDNDIMFIANSEWDSENIPIYLVEKDENDVVARRPLEKNIELRAFFERMQYDKREDNLQFTLDKKRESIPQGVEEYIHHNVLHY